MGTSWKIPPAKCDDFLSRLHEKGVKLWLDSGKLNYRARKGAMTAEDKATLQAMRDDIVSVLSRWKSFTVAPFLIEKQESSDLIPLTAQQEAFWNALQKTGISYWHPCALRISGPLKVEVLRQSIEEIIDRHDSLRTRIVLINGVPKQRIDRSGCYYVKVVDLSELPEGEASAGVQRVVEDFQNQRRAIVNDPLYDFRLIKLRERSHLLLWDISHIVSDAFTNALVFKELWLSYAVLSHGRPSPLQSSPTQYADYARWQEKEKKLWPELHGSFWKERLNGATGIQWPTDGDQSEKELEGHAVSISFGNELSDKLRDLAALARATLGMVVLAVYVVVVARWCRQKDFVVFTTATGRDRSELETMAGYCSCPLYLRVQLIDSESFIDLLNNVSQQYHEGLLHQSFRLLTENFIDVPTDTLFQWFPWEPGEASGIPMSHESAKLDIVVEPFPIPIPIRLSRKKGPFFGYVNVFSFWDTDEGIAGFVKRAAHEASVECLAQKFRLVAEEVVKNPYGRFGDSQEDFWS